MKHNHRLMCVALLFATCQGLATQALADTNFFPIMAWNWVPNDPAVLQKMRDCGLTVAGFVSPCTLDNCEAVGLKASVSDPRTSGYDWMNDWMNVNDVEARQRVASLVAEL